MAIDGERGEAVSNHYGRLRLLGLSCCLFAKPAGGRHAQAPAKVRAAEVGLTGSRSTWNRAFEQDRWSSTCDERSSQGLEVSEIVHRVSGAGVVKLEV
jgi:hypothetical protein